MENNKEVLLNQLEKYKKQGGNHASNLIKKWSNWKKKSENSVESVSAEKEKSELIEITKKYLEYRNCLAEHIDELDFEKITSYLNNYKNCTKASNKILEFTSQSNFQSSILEEFLFILFSKSDESWANLKKGKIDAYSNIYFNPKSLKDFVDKSSFKVDEKNQDFTIYKECEIIINKEKKNLRIPIVSIECKTYLDKTMLQGSIATAEKIKRGNPQAKFYIVTETYDVDYEEDIYGTQIDQIYILRKQKRVKKDKESEVLNPISPEVIKNLWDDIKLFLNKEIWSDNKKFVEEFGKILNKNGKTNS